MGALTPSSEYLASLRRHAIKKKMKRQNDNVADVQESLLTLGGRVYMANVTLGSRVYSLVLDTGSSDTWAAGSGFVCKNSAGTTVAQSACGFGVLYNTGASKSYKPYSPPQVFSVNYTSGEYLKGILATELLGIGDVGDGYAPRQLINQTIGLVQQGFWDGDRTSSGLMGLAYTRLASGSSTVGYEAVMFTLFDQGYYPPVFSLALNRPTTAAPRVGGYLAIGGIPSINFNTSSWSETSIIPVSAGVYTYYSINIDGYSITPPMGSTVTPQNYAASRQSIIVDSGTTLIYLPDRIADYIASLFVPAATFNVNTQLYIVNCNALAPRVGVTIAGKTYFISTADLMNTSPGSVGGTSCAGG
ncbi:hypothetical protein N0V94_006822 [Neodidymelliopsis sp. IMI 364377]|nr:hypothetical protein N0V94_006822 [Neodidymelliopsis sp. IMI 364377]